MWGGLRDHLGHKYGATSAFATADWIALTALAVTVAATVSFKFIPRRPQTPDQDYDGALSKAAALLAFLSLIGSTSMITFTTADTVIPDSVPAVATVLVAGFSVATAYCASRYPDTPLTPQGAPTGVPDANSKWPDRTTLVRRAIEIFPQTYLTNISIIQGISLGVMTVETVRFLKHTDPGLLLPSLAQSGLGLVALIIVWYEYTWFAPVIAQWAPTFRDIAIPVLLGVGEIIPSLLLGQHFAWWIAFAAFSMFGAVALLNTITRLRAEMFPGRPTPYARVRRLLYRLAIICVLTSATAILVSIFISRQRTSESAATIVAACAIGFAATVTIIGYSRTTLNAVYADYGIGWRPAEFQRLRKDAWGEQRRAPEHSANSSPTIPHQDAPLPTQTSTLPKEHGTCPDNATS